MISGTGPVADPHACPASRCQEFRNDPRGGEKRRSPYDRGVDRLDSWLVQQAGWRRGLLSWLLLCPPAIVSGLGTNGLLAPGDHASPLSLVVVGVWSVAIAALVTAVALGFGHVLSARRKRAPLASWRMSLGVELSAVGGITEMAARQLGVSRTLELAADIIGLALLVPAVVLLVLGAIQVTQQATAQQQGTWPAA